MLRWYIQLREQRLARQHEPFKKVSPLEWGLDCLDGVNTRGSALDAVLEYVEQNVANSDQFFLPTAASDYTLTDRTLTYPSAITTETKENNIVYCHLFETGLRERIVLVLPHWNAPAHSYEKLCKVLGLCGIPTVLMTMPYHDERRPRAMAFAEYMVSSNIGRTIRSLRQIILDARLAINWLEARGYKKFGVLGSSLGSSIATILSAHDPRVNTAALNLMASDFAEVVWTGHATKHIREGLEKSITLQDLKHAWSIISPITYVKKLKTKPVNHFIISAKYDEVFLPYLTECLIDKYKEENIRHQWKVLPCGHYTVKIFPFNLMLIVTLNKFFKKYL